MQDHLQCVISLCRQQGRGISRPSAARPAALFSGTTAEKEDSRGDPDQPRPSVGRLMAWRGTLTSSVPCRIDVPIVSRVIIYRIIIDLLRRCKSVFVTHVGIVLPVFSSIDSLSKRQCVVVFHPSVRIFSSLTEKMSALLAARRRRALLGYVKTLTFC